MKKTVKIMYVLLIVMMLFVSMGSIVFADTASTVLNQMEQAQTNGSASGTNEITTLGGRIVTIVQVVGVIIAVIILLVIGIKYLLGSAEEKAEYKKTMIPYLVGAVLIFAGSTIVNAVYNVITGLR